MDPFRDENELGAALRAIRPESDPAFAAELDARVAAGFPRSSRLEGSGLGSLFERLRSTPPRRILAPVGALALSALVIATAVVSLSENESTTPGDQSLSTTSGVTRSHGSVQFSAPANGSGASGSVEKALGQLRGGGGDSSSPELSQALPSAAAAAGEATAPLAKPHSTTGPYASHASHRAIERSAEIVLSAEPSDVRKAAAGIFEAVHAAHGIVLDSSIRDGESGEAGAEFELLIPTAKLGDAMAALSSVAEVRSRHESTEDITAPTVGTAERLSDANARVRSLLAQLAAADTDAERVAAEAELRAARARAAAIRSRLSSLGRRANFSRVSVRIETGGDGVRTGGAWGIDDGLDDAGRLLAIAAGVLVIALAILGPLALVALFAWLAHGAWVRRARRQALAQP